MSSTYTPISPCTATLPLVIGVDSVKVTVDKIGTICGGKRKLPSSLFPGPKFLKTTSHLSLKAALGTSTGKNKFTVAAHHPAPAISQCLGNWKKWARATHTSGEISNFDDSDLPSRNVDGENLVSAYGVSVSFVLGLTPL